MNEIEKLKRPAVVNGSTWCVSTGCGKLYIIINRIDGKIFEVFLHGGKAGGCMTAQTETIGKLVSQQARYGLKIDSEFVKKYKGTICWQMLPQGQAQSCTDAMAMAIEMDIEMHDKEESDVS